ncbi:vWA domain-containing protein [Aporhodopirellula aestuarii]|uniref:VWA domain-containing protein n=1 Tax=Aporhodopirellula aestuarii TaxID=2950107 RepID=A0ABT0UFS7_9BACT|nr:vWA domain-containing protein [Aporhodopirellula aestuarii]MCM2375053.1 VWA domain-containing protein [Aporhodopirellula aestuarii]
MNVPSSHRWDEVACLGGLRFSTDWPAWVIVAASLTVAFVVMWLYLRETASIGSPWSWLLPAMRGTAVVLACLLLAGPVWHHRQVVGNPAKIVWAVDRSQSMGQQDSQSGMNANRLRRATDLLFGRDRDDGWIEQLRETHLMDVVAFDERSRVAWSSEMADSAFESSGESENKPNDESTRSSELLEQADGLQTDLSSPLSLVSESVRASVDADRESDAGDSEDVASRVVVLFSDGRDSAGRSDAAELATQLADAGWQVHTVGMGSVEESPDVGVIDVDVPERVADDGRLAGRVWVKHYGHEQRTARVEIRSENAVVWTDTFAIKGDGKTPVDFDFAVESLMERATLNDVRGVDRDSVALSLTASVSIDDVVGEDAAGSIESDEDRLSVNAANDSMAFRVAAASRERRLLILDGSARWEVRYLRNLFSRDPAWAVDTVLFGRGTDSPVVKRGEDFGELPGSARAWSRYDAVILGEIPPDQWTWADASRLSEFVAGGGGLIVVDGRYGRVAELLSVQAKQATPSSAYPPRVPNEANATREARMAALLPVQFNETDARRSDIRWIEPTDMGRSNPVMLLDVGGEGQLGGGESGESVEIWKHLRAPTSMTSVTPQPDAEVWAEAVDGAGERSPWLVTRLFGAGRVFYLASDQTWRWRYKVESKLHSRFWNQLMTAAMQPPYAVRDEFVAIGTDKIDYRVGQSATIRVRLLHSMGLEGDAVTSSTVDALVLKDDHVVASIPLRLDDPQRRTYVGQTDALPEGEYRVRVRASGFDSAALKATTPFWVVPPRRGELDRVSVDEATLQRIATAGGGVYVHESSADDILSRLKPLSSGRIVESDTPLWQTWWIFVIMIALLATEWWFRKKVGLV